ncbi:GNAT family N-acetyltransferase [Paenibacillus segetis]|uniref:N-acetyltransferase YobR n=1 Tax=Paenibacillus segetis TaxID=1325360 RepID=A0ABQ1YST5_9BACL|nr:GNAT family N-acetyltransferase [Paenibacillus segetis]GGH37151.1 putative N-acetyltransferase YobR [Paenibacillus segetis]
MAKISELIYSEELYRSLEHLAANAWPPREQADLGNWRLRAHEGVTRRGNSVLTAGPFPEGDWLEEVERFYRNRGILPCFQVSDSSPPELDKILELKDYAVIMQCFMMVASCEEILRCTAAQNLSWNTMFNQEINDLWLDDFIEMEEFPEDRRSAYGSIFAAIKDPKCFAALLEDGERIGLGTVAVENGWGGISNVVVASSHRRKGVASALIRALTEWSMEHGAGHMYLQVLRKNTAAVDLYQKLGFSAVSSYHYRVHKE